MVEAILADYSSQSAPPLLNLQPNITGVFAFYFFHLLSLEPSASSVLPVL
jgi:hypothetical protein